MTSTLNKTTSSILHLSKYIIDLYNNGYSCSAIGKELKIDNQAVLYLLKRMGLYKSRCIVSQTLNHTWLDNIDTEYKAYFLGLIAADGSITKNEISISLQEPDQYILDKLAEHINPNIVIKTYPPYNKSRVQHQCRLVITSKQWVQKMLELGLTNCKSLTMKQIASNIPANVRHHFVRGYFDGDGCICKTKYKNKNQVAITILGTKEFLEDLHTCINIPIGTVRLKHNARIHVLSYWGKCRQIELLEYMYANANIYLNRKYLKFIE